MEKRNTIDDLKQGDIITIRTVANIDGVTQAIKFDGMIYNDKFDADGKFAGFEVLPVIQRNKHAITNRFKISVTDPRDIDDMGLSLSADTYVLTKPVVVKAELFEEDGDIGVFFKGHTASPLLRQVLATAAYHDGQGKFRHPAIAEMNDYDMVWGLPRQQPLPTEQPAATNQFNKAVLDIKLEHAGLDEVFWIDPRIAKIIGNPEKLLPPEEQIKKGAIQEGEEPVEVISTMRQLERQIQKNPDRLKAFKGIGPTRFPAVLEDTQQGVNEFNEAITDGTVKKEPFSQYVYETEALEPIL